MQKSDINLRTEYAFREKRVAGESLGRIRILEFIRGNKWKAQ